MVDMKNVMKNEGMLRWCVRRLASGEATNKAIERAPTGEALFIEEDYMHVLFGLVLEIEDIEDDAIGDNRDSLDGIWY